MDARDGPYVNRETPMKTTAAAAAFLAFAVPAAAQELDTVRFGTNWLGFAEYSVASFDEGGAEADIDEIQIGFGGHFPMSDDVDFIGKLAYVDQSIDVSVPGFGSVSDSENGYMLSAGVRGVAMGSLDLTGEIQYVDVGESDDTGLALRGLYQFTDMFSLGARVGMSDDVTEYGVFARFTF